MMQSNRLLLILFAAGLVMIGCDNSTDPSDTGTETLDEDVAVAVAGFLSEDGGGMTDQLEDVSFLASGTGLQFTVAPDGAMLKGSSTVADTSYDDATGWWTGTMTRNRTSLLGLYESHFERVYQFQFLNSAGQPQRRYIVQTANGSDTAHTINFKVLSGTGYHRSPIRVHYLESMTADWVITQANTPILMINGTSSRSGKDTLTTRESVRTHANSLSTTLINVTKPRYRLGATRDDISGTVMGTYNAEITFTRGDLYRERTVQKDFTVELSGDEAQIGIGGRRFRIGWKRGEFFGSMR